jgi:multidrug resistance efflux pump
MIFYFHPSSRDATALFRTVSILPETSGRVAEVYIKIDDEVTKGQPLFRLDSSLQEAALETARRRVAEVDAETAVATTELAAADGVILQAREALQQATDELETKQELRRRNADVVAAREIERLQNAAEGRQGAVDSSLANKRTVEKRLAVLLPAQKSSAEAALKQAQAELDRTVIRAGVSGKVQQFVLRAGDVVNPMIRAAGVLVPHETVTGNVTLVAGFHQIEAEVMKVGMVGEALCPAKPFTIIPLVVTSVQNVIAAGQVRGTDVLVELQQVSKSGTITVFMESLYPGQLEEIPRGSSCVVNAYTSNHERIASGELSTAKSMALHVVDATGLVHAILLRIQAVLMPVTTLVLSGH